MSKRFVIPKENITVQGTMLTALGRECSHLCALRKQIGDVVNINEYMVKLHDISSQKIQGEIISTAPKNGEAKVNITLAQCYLKGDKMDYVTQKAVELGVTHVLPLLSSNCVVKLDEKDAVKKQERLNKIAIEAIGQCGRTDTVSIYMPINIKDIDFSKYDSIIVCHEQAKEKIDSGDILGKENILLIIGPEGGLNLAEIEYLEHVVNSHIVSLGDRVLRAETASVCALSIIGYICG